MVALPPYYLPDLAWWAVAVRQGSVAVSTRVQFEKQTNLSRTHIKGPNGVAKLIIPITHESRHNPIEKAQISHAERWQQVHIGAIRSAYGKTAFWEHYGEELLACMAEEEPLLLAWNMRFIRQMADWLELPVELIDAPACEPEPITVAPYFQPFGDFAEGLSAIDLLFNCGPMAAELLREAKR